MISSGLIRDKRTCLYHRANSLLSQLPSLTNSLKYVTLGAEQLWTYKDILNIFSYSKTMITPSEDPISNHHTITCVLSLLCPLLAVQKPQSHHASITHIICEVLRGFIRHERTISSEFRQLFHWIHSDYHEILYMKRQSWMIKAVKVNGTSERQF